nr:capsid protein [Sarcosphaera coronaria partitivirus]
MPNFSNIFRKREGTRSSYVKNDDTKQRLPAPPKNEDTVRDDGEDEDQKKKKDQAEDDAIEEGQGGNKDSEEGPAPTKTGPKKGKKDKVAIRNETTATPSSNLGSFQRIWNLYTDITFKHVQADTSRARFIPNAIPLLELLEGGLELVGRSNWITKNETRFNPYAVITGYSFIYYIQILRAKESALDLQGQEASALSRFKKFVPLESIPIPDYLVPFYETIVATQLEDVKYEWIVPTFGTLSQLTAFDQFGHDDQQAIGAIRPPIPLMLSILAQMGVTRQVDFTQLMTSDRVWTPIELDRTANATTRLFGADIRFDRVNQTVDAAEILLQCGLSTEAQFSNNNAWDAISYIKKTEFYGDKLTTQTANAKTTGIDVIITPNNLQTPAAPHTIPRSRGGTAATNQFLETKNVQNIDAFLFLEKSKNPRWFSYLLDQMTVFSRHFTSTTTLAKISTTGGLASSILTELRTPQAHANRYVYPDRHVSMLGSAEIEWYTKTMTSLTAYHRAVRADIDRAEQLQALAFGSNAIPPIHGIDVALFREGSYFTDATAEANLLEVGHAGTELPGHYTMYHGWLTDVIRPTYTAKPSDQK